MPDMHISDLSVLLVEPSSTQQRIIRNHLQDIGIDKISCHNNAHSALDEMQSYTPDLVISAMHMEDMTGTELVQNMRMHDITLDIPFMLISSETSFHYLDPIRQAGAIAILPKPFELEQLKRALNNTLDFIAPSELSAETGLATEDLKVLVVDDSFTARRHISRVLNNLGIENITEAKDGKEAVKIIADNFFDLIVTDYNMPQMDGKELVEHIRNQSGQASIPVLMVSSESDENRLAAVQQAGVSAICDKPFEPDNVKQLLAKMLS